ncbi:hypothetical protein STANM309S_03051 [Streptomyces tanashiensis]
MPLPARSRSTVSRAAARGTRSPASTPRARAVSAYLIGAERPPASSRSKRTRSTTYRSGWSLKRLCRYEKAHSAPVRVTVSSARRS